MRWYVIQPADQAEVMALLRDYVPQFLPGVVWLAQRPAPQLAEGTGPAP